MVNPFDVTARRTALHEALIDDDAERTRRSEALARGGVGCRRRRWFADQLAALDRIAVG